MKTYFLTGDCDWQKYGGTFVTKKLNNGDWDYWLIIQFINMDEYCSDYENKYVAEIGAVSPEAAGPKNIEAALQCCCLDLDNFDPKDKQRIVLEALVSYGVYTTLDSFSGNNYKKVMQQARRALPCVAGMFGFFMDGPKNRLGHTGWDFIAGDLSLDKIDPAKKPSPNFHVVEN